ncbi:LysR family transcriptional regulator [Lentisphaera profundi]|uniref:LysR family transcriptional regulator n=1 Tax=Lentisphaera profundi TaxID=1658616 RepID=A0ABY7VPU7_9BACT|nr:LysR family transcriptional regulator [Lentisphaera profundi]WDE95749.1 LysR family transcriptional regulator [Lentisphaera profundi]
MDELKRIGIFKRVVEAQSFSEAARQVGVAKSAVSKQISELEKEVGIRLLNRTTRSLSLTEAGEIYYRHSVEIINRSQIALDELRQYKDQPSGTLRVSSSVVFGASQLVPIIKELRDLYPQLKVDLLLDDRIINMVDDGVDLAIRIGWMKESNLVAKKIAETPMVLCASPEYLAQRSQVLRPEDLLSHNWISLSILNAPLRWSFWKNKREYTVQLHSEVKTNSASGVLAFIKDGQGIAAVAKFTAQEDLLRGNLETVLPDYQVKKLGIYAVYPHRDHVPAKVRVFMDFLEKRCQQADWCE